MKARIKSSSITKPKMLITLATLAMACVIAVIYVTNNSEKTEVVDKHQLYLDKKRDQHKYDGIKELTAFHREIRTKYGHDKPDYSPDYKMKALAKLKKNSVNRNSSKLDWKERGPSNSGGRVRGIALNYGGTGEEGSSFFIGSAGGGVWKTDDFGKTWTNTTPDLPCLSTTTIGTSPDDPMRIYAGSGEGIGGAGDIAGCGIFRSDDGGQSWTLLSSTEGVDFGNITRLVVNPTNADEVVVTTYPYYGPSGSQALKSTDGGQTWVQIYAGQALQQVVADPNDFNTLYLSDNSVGIFKTTNAGQDWEKIYSASTFNGNRIEMAVSRVDPDYIYVQVEANIDDGNTVLEYSKDGGKNWNLIRPASDSELPINFILGSQGWYDNTIAAHPTDVNTFYAAGVTGIVKIHIDETEETLPIATYEPGVHQLLAPVDYAPLYKGYAIAAEFPDAFPSAVSGDEMKDIMVRYGDGFSQRAHYFKVNADSTDLTYTRLSNVPFQVWTKDGSRQLNVAILDQNGNRQYDYVYDENKPLEDQLIDPFFVLDEEYTGSAIDTIKNNYSYRSMYYIQLASTEPSLSLKDTMFFNYGVKGLGLSKGSVPVTDGYGQFNAFGTYSPNVHVDHHNILVLPGDTEDGIILNANDGGIAVSTDGGQSFLQTGSLFSKGFSANGSPYATGLNIAQFYGADKMPGGDRYIGGTQDNGSFYSTVSTDAQTEYEHAPSGDGFGAAWHGTDTLKMLESSQFNQIYRTENNGYTWVQLDIFTRDSGPFVTQIANSDRLPDRVYVSSDNGVFYSKDFGKSWDFTRMSQGDGYLSSGFMTPIKVSNADPLVVWTGAFMSESNGLTPMVSKDGGITYSPTSSYFEMATRFTNIETDPIDPATAYVLLSLHDEPKILKTTDFGESWEDISGFDGSGDRGFPDVAVYSLLVMPHEPATIWVGTDIGLIESTDAGASWHLADNGIPNSAIWEMKIVDDQVVVATHGRGIWTVQIEGINDFEAPSFVGLPVIETELTSDGSLNGTLNLNFDYDSTILTIAEEEIDGNLRVVENLHFGPNTGTVVHDFSLANLAKKDTVLTFILEAVSIVDGRELKDDVNQQVLILEDDLLYTKQIDFESDNQLFARSIFKINEIISEYGKSLQTHHPYLDNRDDQYAILRYPFVVTEDQHKFQYDEIALAEPGEPDVFDYLDENFYDWFGVMLSLNKGQSWQPIFGYDKRDQAVWENYTFSGIRPPDSSMVRTREVDLLDYPFVSVGDTVYLRFQVHADPYASDWGWMLDNVSFDVLTPTTEIYSDQPTVELYPSHFSSNRILNLDVQGVDRRSLFVNLYNIEGKTLWTQEIRHGGNDGSQYQLKLPRLTSGVYFVRVTDGKNSFVKRIVKS